MSGLFGVIGKKNCVDLLFYGTDYHSHLGTEKAGIAIINSRIERSIHDISTSQFKSKFNSEISSLKASLGIGVISDNEPQPITISSSFGKFVIATSGLLSNKDQLAREMMNKGESFSELSKGEINPTEVAGKIIASKESIAKGIEYLFSKVKGSLSVLVLSKEGIYAGRDKFGRTPLLIGKKSDFIAVASESCSFPNLGFEIIKELLPGEIILLTKKGLLEKLPGEKNEKICSFLWIYTGYPASLYDGVSVEVVRERCGKNLAKGDNLKADLVTGIPDSGIIHGLGYAIESKIPYRQALVKYTPGYGRSYTPPSQEARNKIAQLKLIPVKQVIEGNKIVICDDSIVRGTQLRNQAIQKLWHCGAKEIHVRISCPPLMYPCLYCLSTRTKKELAARRAIRKISGEDKKKLNVRKYLDDKGEPFQKMVEEIRKELEVTSLKYLNIDLMIEAIGLSKDRLCTYCWRGE